MPHQSQHNKNKKYKSRGLPPSLGQRARGLKGWGSFGRPLQNQPAKKGINSKKGR